MQLSMFLFIAALWANIVLIRGVQKYYMEDDCGKVIDMDYEDITAGRLLVTRRSKYRNKLSCYVTIVAPGNKRLIMIFRMMDIEFESTCDDDYVTLLDGYSHKAPVVPGFPKRLCGTSAPKASYVTSGANLTVFFKSDIQKRNDGFEMVFTAFHEGPVCHPSELRCENGRCIDTSLSCNGVDNCGDGSDECEVSHEAMYAILLSVFLLTLVAVGLVTIHRKRKKKLAEKIYEKRTAVYGQHRPHCENGSSGVYPYLMYQVTKKNPSRGPRISHVPEVTLTAPSTDDSEPEVFYISDSMAKAQIAKRASI